MENKLKKNSKKGFTLVELIVVLVILAILAALLIPSLTGYIKKAKEKQIIAETRQAVMAAQTLTDEIYATGATPKFDAGPGTDTDTDTVYADNIQTLAEVKGTITNVTFDNNDKGKIKTLEYKNGKTCTYTAADADPYKVTD